MQPKRHPFPPPCSEAAAVVEPVVLRNHLCMTAVAGTVDNGDFPFLRSGLHAHDGADFRNIFRGTDRAERRIGAARDNGLGQITAAGVTASAAVRARQKLRDLLDARIGRHREFLCRKPDQNSENQPHQSNHSDGDKHTFHNLSPFAVI